MTTTTTTSAISESQEIAPFVKFEEFDEEQIVKEIRGEVIEQYFYSFEIGGRQVVGISYSGVRHIALEMMRQGFPLKVDCTVEDCGETYRAKAIATNITTGASYPGFAEQKKKFKDGEENPFAYVMAASKAERNALRKHIAEKIIIEAYSEWKNMKRKQQQSAAASPVLLHSQPPLRSVGSSSSPPSQNASPSPSSLSSSYATIEFLLDGMSYPIAEDEHPFRSFFLGKVCKGICDSHPDCRYELVKNASGEVVGMIWWGLDSSKYLGEIKSALDWTLKRIDENRRRNAK
jgi:hypothetical protein